VLIASTPALLIQGYTEISLRRTSEERLAELAETRARMAAAEQARLVEQPVRPFVEQAALVAFTPAGVATRQGERDQPEIRPSETTADIGQDHAEASSD